VAAVEDWIDAHMRNVDAHFAEFLNGCDVERCGGNSGIFGDADCSRACLHIKKWSSFSGLL
jgi:hypothetical protein